MNLQIVNGDLLLSQEQYLCHQVNSVTSKAAQLAKSVFSAFPYADIYSKRATLPKVPLESELPGNIIICGNGLEQRYIINMVGQYYPGKPRYPDGSRDGYQVRQVYFQQCLERIAAIPDLQSIALPFNIGCGLAGGDWNIYRKMIKIFAESVPQVSVRVYRK